MSINFLLLKKNYNLLVLLLVPVAAVLTMAFNFGIFFDGNNDIFGTINNSISNSMAYAQQPAATANQITIAPASAQFSPLTNAINNQLKVIINYKTNDLY